MDHVHFATTNAGKANTLNISLSRYGITVMHVPLELPEPRTDDLRKIAEQKIVFAYDHIRQPSIAIDSGFYVHSLNGFPKAFVNFALQTIGIEGILRLANGKPRECEFRNCLAYLDERLSEPAYFESITPGTLSETPRGEKQPHHWSDLFQIFIPAGEDKTWAEMPLEEYQAWSQTKNQGSFTRQFGEWFSKR